MKFGKISTQSFWIRTICDKDGIGNLIFQLPALCFAQCLKRMLPILCHFLFSVLEKTRFIELMELKWFWRSIKSTHQIFRVVVAVPTERSARIASIFPIYPGKPSRHCAAIGVRCFRRSIGNRHAIFVPSTVQRRRLMLQFHRGPLIQHKADNIPSFWIGFLSFFVFCLPHSTNFSAFTDVCWRSINKVLIICARVLQQMCHKNEILRLGMLFLFILRFENKVRWLNRDDKSLLTSSIHYEMVLK